MTSSYQVLARKYRPQRFDEVVGQEPVVRTLANALETGRIHHAFVFSGIRGVGKTTTARLLARALNCANGPTAEPCGTCDACREISDGRSMDAIEIDAASNRGIDEVKGLIQSAQYAPSRDRHKVFIVDEFHMLTREAFNALLKTLEEPPPHVVFILATTELEKVPATILSRCLLLPFRPVGAAEVRDHLLDVARKEDVSLEAAAAELIVRKAGGSVRDAQSTLDRVIALAGTEVSRDAVAEALGLVDARVLRDLLRAVIRGSAGDALGVVAEVAQGGADLPGFLDDLTAEARALLLAKATSDPAALLGLTDDEVGDLRAVADGASEDDLRRVLDGLLEAGPRLRQALEPRFVLEATCVRLAHLTRLEPIADLVRRLELGDPGPPPAAGPAPAGATSPREAGSSPEPDSAPGAADARADTGGWRDRVAAALENGPAPEDSAPAPVAPRPAARPARAAPTDPLAAFRDGLPARLRGPVEHALLKPDADGLAIVVPPDRAAMAERLDGQRFLLMAAAASAFGRPVPVAVTTDDGVLAAGDEPGQIVGDELAARRRVTRAEASPQVRAVLDRFEGRVVDVEPVDPERPRREAAGS